MKIEMIWNKLNRKLRQRCATYSLFILIFGSFDLVDVDNRAYSDITIQVFGVD